MILCTATEVTEEDMNKVKEKTKEEIMQSKIFALSANAKQQVEILLTFGHYHDSISDEDLKQLPNLKWIQVMSSGIEQLPFQAMRSKNVLLTSARGVHAVPISEYVLSMILYFAKNIQHYRHLQKEKIWGYSEEVLDQMTEISGNKIGILGAGSIGSEIAKKAKAFGMRTLGLNSNGRSVDGFDKMYPINQIGELLPQCDYICAALPSNQETKHIIDARMISLMKDGVVFINVGRGDAVVENDLIQALRTEKITAAALDVFQEEPLPPHHPFWGIDNLVITPHVSSCTSKYIPRTLDIFFENYRCYKKKRFEAMINRIDFHI